LTALALAAISSNSMQQSVRLVGDEEMNAR
jgi:hypothetical protein